MNIAVRYASRGGNTKQVAEAIAVAAGVTAETVAIPLPPGADLLFLGGAVYAGGIDTTLREFIDALSPNVVGVVAVFSTAAVKTSAYPQMKKLLQAKGTVVLDQEYHCRGQFTLMHHGRPNAEDLARAARFAQEIIQKEEAK